MILSLSLMKESPKGYRLLQKIFNLPTKRTLNCLAKNIKLNVGINENIFKILKNKAQKCCGKIFTCMAHLRYHMPIHAETKQFKCDICDKRFAFKANLMNHVVIHDASRPRVECSICGKNFSNQQNRWRHMFLHKGIKFKCDICDKSFNTEPQRALHVAHVHMKVPWPKRNRGPRVKAHARHAMYTSDSQDS